MINVTTLNFTRDSECLDLGSHAEKPFHNVTKWIALMEAVGIIFLNTMLIVMLSRLKKPSRMAFFVYHLAVADLCVGLLYVLPECILDRFMESWEKFSCLVLYGYCANLSIFASTFLIVVLTIDRLFVIISPMSASKTGKRYKYGLVSGGWFLAILLAIPYGINVKFLCTTVGNVCFHHFQNIKAMVLAEVFINVIIPVFIIAFCYTWIIVTILRREKRGFTISSQKVRYSNGSTKVNFKELGSRSSVISNAKKKVIKILLVVVVVYILSWTPINVAQVLNVFEILDPGNTYIFLHVLAPMNSLMNPIVFIVFNKQMLSAEKDKRPSYTAATNTLTENAL